jgi:hypothetical protein
MVKKLILNLVLLLNITNIWSYEPCDQKITLNDLEFYINTYKCFEKYAQCQNNLTLNTANTTGSSSSNNNCLDSSQCAHLGTLQALLSLPYVQNLDIGILDEPTKLAINQMLVKNYGLNNLEQLVEENNILITKNLINDLIKALSGPDYTILVGANAAIAAPVAFST